MPARLLCPGLLFVLTGLTGVSSADMSGQRSPWRHSLSVASIHVPDSRLDGGGRTGLTSYHLRAGTERQLESSVVLGLGANYDTYHRGFSGTNGFAAPGPWSDTHELGINGQLTSRSRHGWSYGFRPFIAWSSESGNLNPDAMSYGIGTAVAAAFSPQHRAGVGVRITRSVDRSVEVHPILIVDWEFNERWALRNPQVTSFAAPAGLELVYRKRGDWRFAVAAIYRSTEFRLDESRVAPDGIGESSGILSFFRVTRHWAPGLNVNAYLGAVFEGELRVDDAAGRRIATGRYDPAPLLGLSVEGSF